MTSTIEWHKIDSVEDLPKKYGYYLINVYTKSEQDYIEVLNKEEIDSYCHGEKPEDIWNCVKHAYYNPAAKLWESNHNVYNGLIRYVDAVEADVVTHWAEMPKTPNVEQQEPEHEPEHEQPRRGFLGMKWGYNN